jgi:hypothetical protein
LFREGNEKRWRMPFSFKKSNRFVWKRGGGARQFTLFKFAWGSVCFLLFCFSAIRRPLFVEGRLRGVFRGENQTFPCLIKAPWGVVRRRGDVNQLWFLMVTFLSLMVPPLYLVIAYGFCFLGHIKIVFEFWVV